VKKDIHLVNGVKKELVDNVRVHLETLTIFTSMQIPIFGRVIVRRVPHKGIVKLVKTNIHLSKVLTQVWKDVN